MAGQRASDLSPGEWAVLALIAQAPTHGFAIAKALAPDGEVGRVWTLPRPLVYRAIDTLQAADLIEPRRTEQGQGPRRTVVATTRRGKRFVAEWLEQPVEHVREARSQLLLKLLFLDRVLVQRGVLDNASLRPPATAFGDASLRLLGDHLAALDLADVRASSVG